MLKSKVAFEMEVNKANANDLLGLSGRNAKPRQKLNKNLSNERCVRFFNVDFLQNYQFLTQQKTKTE
jgi:hypothetical protein